LLQGNRAVSADWDQLGIFPIGAAVGCWHWATAGIGVSTAETCSLPGKDNLNHVDTIDGFANNPQAQNIRRT